MEGGILGWIPVGVIEGKGPLSSLSDNHKRRRQLQLGCGLAGAATVAPRKERKRDFGSLPLRFCFLHWSTVRCICNGDLVVRI